MPSAWLAVDSNFPSFHGEEPIREQVSSLLNYMFVLTEQLRYSLANLTPENWNASALQDFQSGTTAAIRQQIQLITQSLNQTINRTAALSEKTDLAEQDITALKNDLKAVVARLEKLEGCMAVTQLPEDKQQLQLGGALTITDTENGEKRIDLDGVLYINGVQFGGMT